MTRRYAILGGAFLLLGSVFIIDYRTAQRFSIYLFYLPSLVITAWYLPKTYSVVMVGLASILWAVARAELYPGELPLLFYCNAAVRLITFSITVYAVRAIRTRSNQIEKQSRELERSNEELDNFAARAAHDLQTPLTMIKGAMEFVAEEDSKNAPNSQREYIAMIFEAVNRMSKLIEGLLAYSRVQKGEMNQEAFDSATLVHEVVSYFQFAMKEKKAEITYDSLPVVRGNRSMMGQLFQNLIGNALKYCEAQPRIHISACRKKNCWIISVQDNGIGIPPADSARVFKMFEKLPTKVQYGGSGIGLATCKKIVELHGGRIWVEANLKGGSIFRFSIPLNGVN